VYGQDQAYQVNPGQAFRFVGPDLRNVQALDPRQRDDFDRWAAERDRRAERAVAARYVPRGMIGAEDLDDYGNWRTEPGYGPVWMPARVERGWAPYRDGHWAWIEPWGWTWVDDAPWGFAVTHYGRWANFGGNWGWVPGPARAEPVYAPALVVFAGAASLMASRSPREHAVAWFPLGPREAYRPPYPASPRYVTSINNTTYVVNNVYVNRQVSGATTAVPGSVFTRAQPVRRAAIAVPKDAIARAPVVASPPVTAQRESHASRLDAGHRPAPAMLARPVMTHMRPAIAAPRGQAQPNIAAAHQLAPGAAPMPVPQPAHGRPFAAAPQPALGAAPQMQAGVPRPSNEAIRPGIPPAMAHPDHLTRPVPNMPPEAERATPAMQRADHAPVAARPAPGVAPAGWENAQRHLASPPQGESREAQRGAAAARPPEAAVHLSRMPGPAAAGHQAPVAHAAPPLAPNQPVPYGPATAPLHAPPPHAEPPHPLPQPAQHEFSPPHSGPAIPHPAQAMPPRERPQPHPTPAMPVHEQPQPHPTPAMARHEQSQMHPTPAMPRHEQPPPHPAPASPHHESSPPHPAPAMPAHESPPQHPAPASVHHEPPPHPVPAAAAQPAPAAQHEAQHQHGPDRHKDEHH
jgi:hypothetical protein